MDWFKSHWKAVGVCVLLFFLGAAIGTSGSSSTSSTTTIIRDHTVTAQGTASQIASTVTETQTVTTTVRAAKPKPKPTPTAKRIRFSGNGGKTLPPFTVGRDSTLRWTNDGDIFQIFDLADDFPGISVNSQAHSGTTAVSAGRYSKIEVNAIGNWAITIS